MLKDMLKLSLVNSSNIWKLLLYRFLCLLCVLGLTTVIAWPIISVLIKNNFFINLQNSFESIVFTLNFEKVFLTVDDIVKSFVEIISGNALVVQTILCGTFVLILISLLENYAKVALHQNVYGYMSSLTKYGFTNSYVANFGKATVLGVVKLITIVPINIFIWVGAYLLASTLYTKIGVFAIVLVLLLLMLVLSFKNTFIAGWIPAMIINGESVLKSLKMSFKSATRSFFKKYSSFLIYTVAVFMLNLLALALTAGAAMLVTLPLTTLMTATLGEVMYFETLGMRYYVDTEHIVNPKKLEERDSFQKLKDII